MRSPTEPNLLAAGISGDPQGRGDGLEDHLRFVVTSLDLPTPECLYRDLYSACGQDENFLKMVKNDLASDRTSDHRFLANHLRLFFSCAAYVLHQALRTESLVHTELAKTQPVTVIIKLFKLAVRVVAYQDRIKLHLPTSYPVKVLLRRVTDLLFLTRPPPPLLADPAGQPAPEPPGSSGP